MQKMNFTEGIIAKSCLALWPVFVSIMAFCKFCEYRFNYPFHLRWQAL